LKGVVQQILRGVETKFNRSVLVNWRAGPFLFLYFKETTSQEAPETIFSGLKMNEMALSDQTDIPAF
jgi:hypothetical protein